MDKTALCFENFVDMTDFIDFHLGENVVLFDTRYNNCQLQLKML